MLEWFRERLHGPFAYALLGALAVVFAAWGASGIVNLNFGSSNYAAEANSSKISLEDARNSWLRQQAQWQQRLGGAEIPPELRGRLQDEVLENLINNALLTERTHDLGYRTSHEALRDAVQNEPAFQVGGVYSPEAAKAALAQAGVSLSAYEDDLSNAVQRVQLEGGIRASGFITPKEAARLSELQDQEREVQYLIVPASQFAAGSALDDAAVQAYYKAHQAQYLTAETDRLQYAELRLDSLTAQQTVSDADLHAAYDKQKSRLEIPEKRHARHILVTGKDDAAALALAQQVLAQAQAGKDFGELAKQYSQDPGSAKNGGDLGWAERSNFVAPFADALFGMQVGEIKGPVKTQFGYHIIRLDEIQAGKTKTFEEARPDLESQLRRDRASDHFGEIQEQLQTKLAEPGADLGAIAQEYHLQQGEVASFVKGSGGAPLGAAPALQQLLFADPPVAAGHLAGPVLVGDDRLAIVKVLEHSAPHAKPLAEVHDGIVAAITKERAMKAALSAAQMARTKLQAGASFDALAQELKAKAEPARFAGRQDPSLPAEVRTAVFDAPRPDAKPVFLALPVADGAALVAVTHVRTAPPHDATAQANRVVEAAETEGTADAMAYIREVRRTATVRKNPKAFE
jgi:peptidyl-prolyl cis-trans isomerase D